jgi:hypothetical protein
MAKTTVASVTTIPTKTKTGMDKFILFVGVLSILLGLFSAFRVGINYKLYPGKYPTTGLFNPGYYGQREEDCTYPMGPYFDEKSMRREASAEETKMEQLNQERCLSQVKEARRNTEISDLTTEAFFLFIGIGVLASKKIFMN